MDDAVAEAGEKMFERETKQKLYSERRSGEPPAAARHDAAAADASMVPSVAIGCAVPLTRLVDEPMMTRAPADGERDENDDVTLSTPP